MPNARQDKARLLASAQEIAERLRSRSAGTKLTIRRPYRAKRTATNGWGAVVGNLGKNQPRLEIWFDRFAGHPDRKFWACFSAENRQSILTMTKEVDRRLWPVRVVTEDDIAHQKYFSLEVPLRRGEFNAPILEKWPGEETYFGIYDPTRSTSGQVSPHFCDRAVAFFLDVIHAMPGTKDEPESREIYPQCENRKRVTSHLQRERSSLLATECKIRDDHTCQVCGLRFEEVYGKLGRGFAEAHHVVPLSQLDGEVKTRLEDLTTVCANCHRMLHRMSGQRGDVARLKAIVARHGR